MSKMKPFELFRWVNSMEKRNLKLFKNNVQSLGFFFLIPGLIIIQAFQTGA